MTPTLGTSTPGTWTGAETFTETEVCGVEGGGAGSGGFTAGACRSFGGLTVGACGTLGGVNDGACGRFGPGVGEGSLPPTFSG